MKRNSLFRKTLGMLFAGLCLLPLCSACGVDNAQGVLPHKLAPKITAPREHSEKLRVLFIGNSFTFFNDLNQPNGLFAKMAKNAGYEGVRVSSVYRGGYYLHQFLDRSDNYGKQVLDLLESDRKYDIVVIQEQSNNAIANPGDFYDSCREFKKLVDRNGGELWLYSTWGYKSGRPELPRFGSSTEDMEMKLRAAYTAIAEELDVGIVYAGAAITRAAAQNPSIDVYDADLLHPSPAGSYLIGCTLFGTIFGVDPLTLTYNGPLDEADAAALRAIASSIVNEGVSVDNSYFKPSAGIHA